MVKALWIHNIACLILMRSVVISEVSSFQGVLISEVSSFQGVLISEESAFQGVLISEESSMQIKVYVQIY